MLCRCLAGALTQPAAASALLPDLLPASPSEWEAVLRLSSAHLATPQLRWALHAQGLFSQLQPDMAEYLEAVYTLNLDRNRQCEDQLAQFIALLNSIGVRPVMLKGAAAIVGELYPTSGERMICDLDVLIPARSLPEILDRLAGVGYLAQVSVGMAVPDPVGFASDHHYPPMISPQWPSAIELHIHPLWLSMVDFLSSDDLFRDAVPVSWRGGDCLLPSPTHFILHNVVHAFLMNVKVALERVSLRQLFEFALASQRYTGQIDWYAIATRFDDLGRRRALQEYLALASTCFNVPTGLDIDQRDRSRVQRYLNRLDSYHRPVEWAIKLLFQVRRLGHLRQDPKKLRMLLTADFYSRLLRSLGR